MHLFPVRGKQWQPFDKNDEVGEDPQICAPSSLRLLLPSRDINRSLHAKAELAQGVEGAGEEVKTLGSGRGQGDGRQWI